MRTLIKIGIACALVAAGATAQAEPALTEIFPPDFCLWFGPC